MNREIESEPSVSTDGKYGSWIQCTLEILALMLVFFVYAGDAAPMVNEAHYLVKAKNFWDSGWCNNDLFAASGKAHTTFYALFGWPTLWCSLEATAWLGRTVGWLMLAIGIQRLRQLFFAPWHCSLLVACVWITAIEYGNLAGEWVVGGIEAKVPAYGLILIALAEMCQRRWNRVWVLLGAASAFHVLSGGWSVVAAIVAWVLTERNRDDAVSLISPWLFAGGMISLFGLIPAIWLTMGSSSADSVEAARIYTFFRIKHHLLPADFKLLWWVRHLGLTAATYVILNRVLQKDASADRWNILRGFCYGATLIALAGLIVGMLPSAMPDLAAKLLRYYWFRLTDAVIPLGFSLGFVQLYCRTKHLDGSKRWRWSICCLVMALFFGSIGLRTYRAVPPSTSNVLLGWDRNASAASQRQAFADWLAVCQWARDSTPSGEVFLTPRHQQTFKWYAHRAEVVNWKDVPQDAKSLKEWKRRFDEIYPRRLRTNRVTIKYDKLREFKREYGTRFMIVDRRITGPQLPLVRVYPVGDESNETFAVYELPH